MSIVALAITLLKFYQFRAVRVGDRRTAREALAFHRAGRSSEALDLLAGARNPTAEVLALAIRGQLCGDLAEATVREEVARVGADLLHELRRYLRPLEVIASLAPLLGLFGTVLGMIEAFQRLEQAGNQVNPAILSGGIWEALLTTAVGLAVAIPTVAVLNWLERTVDCLGHEMESAVTQVFTGGLTDRVEEDNSRELARLRPAAVAPGE
ncbi:MAG: MotA/TolQ/ExbB proton channel family protein [Alphaproteobacteria bacterium]|nr:MAG: MotA/TolQ/ExbB proton channel family protein [Alphaproteobacteria bacterium]